MTWNIWVLAAFSNDILCFRRWTVQIQWGWSNRIASIAVLLLKHPKFSPKILVSITTTNGKNVFARKFVAVFISAAVAFRILSLFSHFRVKTSVSSKSIEIGTIFVLCQQQWHSNHSTTLAFLIYNFVRNVVPIDQ